MQPLIKYSGGKRREIKYFKDLIPTIKDGNKYIEPFVGGGAVFFYLEPNSAIINDLNSELINFYKEVKYNRNQILKEISTLENNEQTYYMIRDMFNNKIPKKYSDATLFYYINRTAFSGMIRYNKDGHFNVPYGWYKKVNFTGPLTEKASKVLRNTEIYSEDFEQIFKKAKKGDFIFLDPPYMSKFKDYNRTGSFTEDDQKRLFNCFKKTKASCMLVISDLGIIRNLYKDYIEEDYTYDKTYAINVKNRMLDNNSVKHLVITNYLLNEKGEAVLK